MAYFELEPIPYQDIGYEAKVYQTLQNVAGTGIHTPETLVLVCAWFVTVRIALGCYHLYGASDF